VRLGNSQQLPSDKIPVRGELEDKRHAGKRLKGVFEQNQLKGVPPLKGVSVQSQIKGN